MSLSAAVRRFLCSLLCRWFRAEALSAEELRQRWQRARRCLLLCGAGIGDAIMALPLLQVLRQRLPELQLAVVTRAHLRSLFLPFPQLSVLSYREGWSSLPAFIHLLWQCWRFRADVFLGAQPANTIRHSLIAVASRAQLRLKHVYNSGIRSGRDLSCLYHCLVAAPPQRHRVELNLDLLRTVGEDIPEGSFYPTYPVPESARRRAAQLLPGDIPRIALHPGSGRAEKRWPIEGFLSLAQRLQQSGYHLVLFGGPEERSLTARLRATLGKAVEDFTGKTDLPETAALLQRCLLLISNDSGIMHLAAAVGVPVIALFLRTDPAHIGPYTPAAIVLCAQGGDGLTVEDVLRAVAQVVPLT